jgi:hypothetical protein
MVDLKLTINGTSLNKAFDALEKQFADQSRRVWPRMEPLVRRQVQENLDTEGRAGGRKFEPLARRTVEYKTRHGLASPILQRTGVMYRAVLDSVAHAEMRAGEMRVIVPGKSGQVAGFHQRGTRRMPARRIFQFSDGQKREQGREMMKAYEQIIHELGFK